MTHTRTVYTTQEFVPIFKTVLHKQASIIAETGQIESDTTKSTLSSIVCITFGETLDDALEKANIIKSAVQYAHPTWPGHKRSN